MEMEGAEHIPLYRLIEGSSPAQIVRKFGHVLFTEFPFTERNYPVRELVPTGLVWRSRN